jgi:YbbR domain-containing protein
MLKSHTFSQNLSMIILSLLVAFFLWAVATENENPTIQRPVSAPIFLEIENLPEGMIRHESDKVRIQIVLRAPKTIWDTLQTDDIHAFVDLSGAEAGKVTRPVRVEVRRDPVQIVEVTPKNVTLTIEAIEEKEVPVEVKTQGTPMLGYTAETPVVVPHFLKIQGPASLVNEVARMQVKIELNNQRMDIQGDFEPVPLDENGEPVSHIEFNPKTVTVNVPVRPLSGYRDLAVKAKVVGQPAPGYRITNVNVKPTIVTVVGRSSVVQSASGYLETEPINLEDATQSMTITAFLQTPEGITVLIPPTPQVTVTVGIEVIESGLTVEQEPILQGLREGLIATVEPTSTVAILSGPIAIMDVLDPNDVQIVLDLTDLAVGEYTLTPRVYAPEGVHAQSILPESVIVTIKEE